MKYISYADWISLISSVMDKGTACDEFEELKETYPHSAGEAYEPMIYNQLGKLEESMLKESVNVFQRQMNSCLDEIDLEIAEMAFSKLKKHYRNCMFFLEIPDYPETLKSRMSEEIIKNMKAFGENFEKYLKKLEYTDSSMFIQDYVYICKKNLHMIRVMY